ncbi:liver-enriched gene 1, tandem duplicate 1 [Chiloscyllium plagiosum]|uniref:liver-enriched gene 1, tandem duplicate 1 n=1 Tax=Chiloscyllium plagiosum TaxID=36176 RepID=UPI001CB87FD9|nr:liver-enriched gene 1, tandem duplicate 1 [Chiloscyllium plagiosum]
MREAENYPPLWDNVPDSLAGFVTIHNKTVINPWNYLERMGMYKILLSVTAKYMESFGPRNTGNVLWGLPLQHGWQFNTGRLADPSDATSCGQQTGDPLCISTTGWWSCMNYYLATIPFLGAVEAGFFDEWPFEIEISPPEEHVDDFCYNTRDCHVLIPDTMAKWTHFFQLLKKTRDISQSRLLPSISPEEDNVWRHIWIAHVSSIEAALPKFSERLTYISAPEAQFGVSWGSAVEFIAAAHFPTNFNQTNVFQVYLPQRMLLAHDKAPSIPDLSKKENWALVALDILYEGNKMTDGRLLKFWRRAMCSEGGREEGRNLLENIVSNPDLILPGIRKILVEFIKNYNCSITDA